MHTESKTLSIIQAIGFTHDYNGRSKPEELCEEIFEQTQNFIAKMIDTVYSDGPVYFVWKPFSDETHNALKIFTTFGNKIGTNGVNTSDFLFSRKIVIRTDDFAVLTPEELNEYYESLRDKYSQTDLSQLSVYHVLYFDDDQLLVDVYSTQESEW
ncbi:hypothetical protein EJ419_02195 [Alloscardovia theropitheci]|uniref:DUF5085 family protein n=1 Tax=Alloscardovia theropitheci TaxID=2496842 RepID=A0A4R0QWB9_9BIFI|nr:hypothetical protein [Alloscardovia theropitheci]TCD54667.1 hypothetical protein EJ419_02195 [Alloscardovia theropitheci]